MIERQGFMDPDRKTSKHDEIQLWTYEHISEVLSPFTSNDKALEIEYKRLEQPVCIRLNNGNKILVGYVDLNVGGEIVDCNGEKIKSFDASIEIKSKIDSCGDLIRQINFYRGYQDHQSTWIVVSPDDRFKDILLQQNIYFFKYKDPATLF